MYPLHVSIFSPIYEKNLSCYYRLSESDLGRAYRGLSGGFLLLRNFSVAISMSPRVCLISVLILISMSLCFFAYMS